MPQLTLEYTSNLEFPVQPLLARIHEALAATGAIRIQGLKSRAVRHADYRIGDGNPEYAFVHVDVRIRQGRPIEVQREAAARVMAILEEAFAERRAKGFLSLSVDVQEMRNDVALTVHNIPAPGHPPGA
jgi:5-carboxymethyl-2-hydroxymuconate isomerase